MASLQTRNREAKSIPGQPCSAHTWRQTQPPRLCLLAERVRVVTPAAPITLVFRVWLPSVSSVSTALSRHTFIPQTLSVERHHGLPQAACPSSIPQGSRGHASSCAQTQELPGGAGAKGSFPFATEKDGSLKTGANSLRCLSENVTCLLRRENRGLPWWRSG